MAFSYNIPNGRYPARGVSASCFEKDEKLLLDIRFVVLDPNSHEPLTREDGYDFEITKRHWLTTADGGFNERTIEGLKSWAKGWEPRTFSDFYWFQEPGNLDSVGEVELSFSTDKQGNQQVWINDPNRQKTRTAYVPEGGIADVAKLAAKWGAKAKALFASTPAKLPTPPKPTPKPVAPTMPTPPKRDANPWAKYPQDMTGCYNFFCDTLDEEYNPKVHDECWFKLMDLALEGKDPDEATPAMIQTLFQLIAEKEIPF